MRKQKVTSSQLQCEQQIRTALANSRLGALLLACLVPLGCGDSQDKTPNEDGVPIGLLLPHTGLLAGSGANIEKAGIMASEIVNREGGVDGEPVVLASGNTHTDVARGTEAAANMLEEQSLELLLGPELAALASRVSKLAEEEDALVVLPGLTKPRFDASGAPPNVITTSPSTDELGCALATRVARDGHRDVLILTEGDDFHQGFSETILQLFLSQGVVTEARSDTVLFRRHGGRIVTIPERPGIDDSEVFTVLPGEEFSQGTTSRMPLTEVVESAGDAVVVAAFPEKGSELLWLLASTDPEADYYLSPALNSQGFLDSLPDVLKPQLLGIGPIQDDKTGFASIFAERWGEEEPFSESWFYFDAMMMSVLAIAAHHQDPSRTLREHMINISRPPGSLIRWDDLQTGLDVLREGGEINYHGVTSSCDVQDTGQLKDGLFILRYWTIEDGERTPELFVNCRGL